MRFGPVLAAALLAASLTACTASSENTSSAPPRASSSGAPASAPQSPPPSGPSRPSGGGGSAASSSAGGGSHGNASATALLARLSEKQRVGQLLMVDCPTSGVDAATTEAISSDDVGSVILDGTSYAGLAHAQGVTAALRRLAPSAVGLFIATDQEGGEVQRLQGSGFTSIVTAVQQGGIAPATLEGYARGWGDQLRAAGVNLNLAPVLDTVPAGFGSNPPIGDLDREFGHTPAVVTAHGLAVLDGMTAAGVDVTVKHFPGLGRVHGNTDLTSGVTDTVTTRDDPYLAPYQAAIEAGAPFVMMSTAIYARIDPGVPAAFSKPIVTGMLRGDLGFQGVVISDDLGAAKQVAGYSAGQRAVDFVAAGGDMVLTVDASEAGAMTQALLAKADSDPAFKQLVDAAALRVLIAKQGRGLLG